MWNANSNSHNTGYESYIKRTAWLRCRLQEVSEREHKAQLLNQKLLRDFQTAQNTLSDLMMCTEIMNTTRVLYERYQEENVPQWQQILRDKGLSEQCKTREQLKVCALHVEEIQKVARGTEFPITSLPTVSPDSSHLLAPPPISHLHPPTSDHTVNMNEDARTGGRHDPGAAAAAWPGLPVANPAVWRTTRTLHPEEMWHSEEGGEEMEMQETKSPRVGNCQVAEQRRMGKGSDPSWKQNTQPVRRADELGDSSKGSTGLSQAVKNLSSEEEQWRKESRRGKQTPKDTEGTGAVCGCFCSSDLKKSKRQKTPKVKSAGAVELPTYLSKQEGDRMQEKRLQSCGAAEQGGVKGYTSEGETEEEEQPGKAFIRTVEKGSDGLEVEGGEEEEVAESQGEKERDVKEWSLGMDGERIEIGASDGEETRGKEEEREQGRSSTCEAESISSESVSGKELHSVRDEEAGDDGEDEEEEGVEERGGEVGETIVADRGSEENEDESEEEESDSEVAPSSRSIHDSLIEIYEDDSDDDQLCDQEPEDDSENEDDDVVIKPMHPRSCDPAYEGTEYEDDDSDDSLLTPQNISWQPQVDETEESINAEESVKPKDDDDDDDDDDVQAMHSLCCFKNLKTFLGTS